MFSEYHAAGAVSGAFMVRKGCWKLIRYIGFDDELFDLKTDPEELVSVAHLPENAKVLGQLHKELELICDPEATDATAFSDQATLIKHHGGIENAMRLGVPGATPPTKFGG